MKYLLLIALVFSLGCTHETIFGGDVLKIQVSTQAEGPKDAIIIKDIETIPKPPILPGQRTSLFFTIENRDDIKEATSVNVDLFNPSSFKPDSTTKSFGKILPGEQEQAELKLTAPTEADIAGVRLETDMHFRVTYDFESSTIMEALVVDEKEILTRQRQGQSVSLERNNIIGSGPIQIEGEMKGTPYILANQPDKNQVVGIFIIKVVNRGDRTKGDLVGGEISTGNLRIEFPSGIGSVKCPEKFTSGAALSAATTGESRKISLAASSCGSSYTVQSGDTLSDIALRCYGDAAQWPCICSANGLSDCNLIYTDQVLILPECGGTAPSEGLPSGRITCKNSEPIKLFKGESNPFKFDITNSPNITEPFRTHNIKAKVSYTYELRASVHAVVNPLQNV